VKGKGSWKKLGASPFDMEQIGFVNPESEKQFTFQQRMRTRFPGIRNFKGFRVYSTDSPMPTIMRWGKEEFCGPGKNTQFLCWVLMATYDYLPSQKRHDATASVLE
jgi:hypothetical protein